MDEILYDQLEALLKEKKKQAKFQLLASGTIEATFLAEIYRLYHQTIAVIDEVELETEETNFLYGLYTLLLVLHLHNGRNEKVIQGQMTPHTVTEIARLRYLCEQLNSRGAQYPYAETAVRRGQQLDLIALVPIPST